MWKNKINCVRTIVAVDARKRMPIAVYIRTRRQHETAIGRGINHYERLPNTEWL